MIQDKKKCEECESQCPVCGYYCFVKGGAMCIDKAEHMSECPNTKEILKRNGHTPLQEEVHDWEEEFAMKFVPDIKIGESEPIPDWGKVLKGTTANYMTLKSFIKSLLTQRSQSLREKIEGIKKPVISDEQISETPFGAQIQEQYKGYNQAIDDILKLIND